MLEPWQREVVEAHPGDFLRGLLHSDGARAANWATRAEAGERRRYEYPRWQFTNHSDHSDHSKDILGLSVSRRADVARLDELVGPKS